MNILVTGGAGFIGSNIVDGLIELGYEVAVVDNLSTGKKEFINPKARLFEMDILDENLAKVFEEFKPEIVFHQAAQIDVQQSIHNPKFDANVNIIGTISVLEQCRKFNVRKIIYPSSAAVYGDPHYLGVNEKHPIEPISNYGISKYVPEHYIQVYSNLYNIQFTILRYANVYGIRQDPKGEGGVISIFVDKMIKGDSPVIFGDGEQTRDFIYVKDVVQANIASIDKGNNGIYNISCNCPTSVNDLVNELNALLGKKIKAIHVAPRSGDIVHSYLDNELAKTELNWEPHYTLRDGLQETLNYYMQKIHINSF